MNIKKILLAMVLSACFGINAVSQCNHTLTINSYSASCNGDGTSTVTTNVTVLFGNGNNSATLSYDIGSGEVVAEVLEDDDGDINDQTYNFDVPSCDNFTVTLTAWTNPSGSGSSCTDPAPVNASIVLPVEFGDFNVNLEKSKVLIAWNTYSEINNDGFEIQRSRYNSAFITIGKVKGAVNSTVIRNYQYEDKLEDEGDYYYRIKQNDLDGEYTFSDIRNISYKHKAALSIFPNPANDHIVCTLSKQGYYFIYNEIGQLKKKIIGSESIITVDISDLSSGTYYMISMDKSESKKFVKK